MDKQDIQSWTGEGLPPAGIDVEYKFTAVTYRADFSVGKVIAIGDAYAFMRHKSSGNEFVQPLEQIVFRPLSTPEQIEAERRERISLNMLQFMPSSDEIDYAQCVRLYDAIRAGKIEGVKIDG